eukprot:comp22718_c0_seq1/m.35287 comp22718_c0_seq1/g.35287  ORF comp22718_c0_seq1/g.35287 comp22718_c0_seq1/m.35287 type:complete len:496 (-) comp22718_c0_seq1:575-2062(-)
MEWLRYTFAGVGGLLTTAPTVSLEAPNGAPAAEVLRQCGNELPGDVCELLASHPDLCVYYVGTSLPVTDGDGWLFASPGCSLGLRYEVEACLGQGVAGRIYQAVDHATGQRVALKTGKAHWRERRDAALLAEHRWLTDMGPRQEKESVHHIVRVVEPGLVEFGPHQALVLELLGPSLHDVLAGTEGPVQRVAADTAQALAFIHRQGSTFIDLKADNVALCIDTSHSPHWLLIDGGAASTDEEILGECNCAYRGVAVEGADMMCARDLEQHMVPIKAHTDTRILGYQSLRLRAPEILLGLVLDRCMDMWSYGLLLLAVQAGGRVPFGDGDEHWSEHKQMQATVQLLGPPPPNMWARVPFTWRAHFFHSWSANMPKGHEEESAVDAHYVPDKDASAIEASLCAWLQHVGAPRPGPRLLGLMVGCLQVDPRRRLTAEEACMLTEQPLDSDQGIALQHTPKSHRPGSKQSAKKDSGTWLDENKRGRHERRASAQQEGAG